MFCSRDLSETRADLVKLRSPSCERGKWKLHLQRGTVQERGEEASCCTEHAVVAHSRAQGMGGRSKAEDWHLILTLVRDVPMHVQRCTQ